MTSSKSGILLRKFGGTDCLRPVQTKKLQLVFVKPRFFHFIKGLSICLIKKQVLFKINTIIKIILIREHFVIQLIMKISEIKLRRFEALLTPLSSNYSCSF